IGAAEDVRLDLEVTVGRRRGGRPFQSIAVPGITAGDLSTEEAVNEVNKKDQLYGAEHEGADAHEGVHGLQVRFEERMRWVGDPAAEAGGADNVHRIKDAIGGDEGEGKVPLAQRFIHHAAKHLGEPVVYSREDPENAAHEEDIVQVRHDEIGVVDVD